MRRHPRATTWPHLDLADRWSAGRELLVSVRRPLGHRARAGARFGSFEDLPADPWTGRSDKRFGSESEARPTVSIITFLGRPQTAGRPAPKGVVGWRQTPRTP